MKHNCSGKLKAEKKTVAIRISTFLRNRMLASQIWIVLPIEFLSNEAMKIASRIPEILLDGIPTCKVKFNFLHCCPKTILLIVELWLKFETIAVPWKRLRSMRSIHTISSYALFCVNNVQTGRCHTRCMDHILGSGRDHSAEKWPVYSPLTNNNVQRGTFRANKYTRRLWISSLTTLSVMGTTSFRAKPINAPELFPGFTVTSSASKELEWTLKWK